MKALIVIGSKDWSNSSSMFKSIYNFIGDERDVEVLTTDNRGACEIAIKICTLLGVECNVFEVDEMIGKLASPRRMYDIINKSKQYNEQCMMVFHNNLANDEYINGYIEMAKKNNIEVIIVEVA
jgi:hypothetical protein